MDGRPAVVRLQPSLLPLARTLLLALFCALAGGCLKPPPPPGVTRLQFFLMGWPPDSWLEKDMIAEFERENPGIKVDLTLVNPNSYSERMQTLIVGGIVPDVMFVDINNYYEWADRGMLVDTTDIMEAAAREQRMTYMPIVPEELLYHGRYFAVPYDMCGVILQINRDIFRKGGVDIPPAAGVTWDWVYRVAPKLSRRSGNPGAPGEFFCSMPDMASLLFTFGGEVFDDDRNPHKVLVRSPQVEEMCRYVRKLVATRAVLSRSEATTGSNMSMQTLYIRGQDAARIHGLWAKPGQYGVPVGFDWDVLPFPSGPGGRRVTANGAYLLGISSRSRQIDAARKFLRFYLSPRGIAIHTGTGAFSPVFRELLARPPGAPPPDPVHLRYYNDTMESGMCRLPVRGPGVAELRRIIDGRLDQVSSEPDVPIPVILKTLEGEIYRWLEREKEDGFYQ